MVNKTISPNLAPWDWRFEQPAQHVDSGPSTAESDNPSETGVSIESKGTDLSPGVLSAELMPHRDQDCIEDRKEPNEIR